MAEQHRVVESLRARAAEREDEIASEHVGVLAYQCDRISARVLRDESLRLVDHGHSGASDCTSTVTDCVAAAINRRSEREEGTLEQLAVMPINPSDRLADDPPGHFRCSRPDRLTRKTRIDASPPARRVDPLSVQKARLSTPS